MRDRSWRHRPKNWHSLWNSCTSFRRRSGAAAIRARDLPRTHRERLLANGFLQEVIKGWYIPSRPDEVEGREHGLVRIVLALLRRLSGRALWQGMVSFAGTVVIAACRQLDGAPAAHREVAQGAQQGHETSARNIAAGSSRRAARARDREEKEGLRLFSPESALIACSPSYFSNHATDVRTVLPMIRDASDLLARLLEGGHTHDCRPSGRRLPQYRARPHGRRDRKDNVRRRIRRA